MPIALQVHRPSAPRALAALDRQEIAP